MKFLVFIIIFIISVNCDDYHSHEKTKRTSRSKSADGGFHIINKMESSADFWREKAQNKLKEILNRNSNVEKKAKNVILFLGDGMGISTIATARMYLGGEQNLMSFEKFPYYGLSKTYCVDKQVPDSACTATSYLTGVKTNYRSIGVNADVGSTACNFTNEHKVYSIAKWAQDAGKSTGFVTNTRVTHASPAGLYAHIPHRDWESNNAIPTQCKERNFEDIGHQFVNNEESKKFKVVLAGGRSKLLSVNHTDDEGIKGQRTDGRNLIDEWIDDRSKSGKTQFIWNNQQLHEIDYDKTDYLLGLFESDHCMYQLDINNHNLEYQEPSLTEMTIAAIKMLEKNKDQGYFLFVEGGRIDMAHHDNRARKAMEETKEFARAVDVAKQMTNEMETLIIVTSDHSHPLTYNGYPDRYSDTLTSLGDADFDDIITDGLKYTIMSYANGPGYDTSFHSSDKVRNDLSKFDLRNPMLAYPSTVRLSSESHSGEDVGIYASGPFAKIFTGNYEQNNIPLLMAYASNIGPYSSSTVTQIASIVLILSTIMIRFCII